MGKLTCPVCYQQYRGIALSTVKDNRPIEVCPNCYKTLDDIYRKNSCIACAFFNSGSCELYGTELDEPYLQSARCEYLTKSTDPAVIARAKEKADVTRGRFKEAHSEPLTLEEFVAELRKRGQTLTYFCCHCGTSLQVGAKQEIQKTCPRCKYDLSAIDMAKLISQHL